MPEPMAGQRYALLIGNSQFPGEPGLAPLQCPAQDVLGLQAVLSDPARGQFKVSTLIDQPRQSIENQLETILDQASQDDTVLIYFSGHGKPSNLKGKLYLAAQDTQLSLLKTTAIAASKIKELIDDAYCNRIILILDCCFSGAIDGEFIKKGGLDGQVRQTLSSLSQDEAHGIHIMTASTEYQSAEEKQGERYSVFTKHLIQGLVTGDADKHATGLISFNDLFVYIEAEIKAEKATQKPQVFNLGGGDLLMALSGKTPRKQRLEKTEGILKKLYADARIDFEMLGEAMAILKTPPGQLSAVQKYREALLNDLCAEAMTPVDFTKKWGAAGVMHQSPAEAPKAADKNLRPAVKESVSKPQTDSPKKPPQDTQQSDSGGNQGFFTRKRLAGVVLLGSVVGVVWLGIQHRPPADAAGGGSASAVQAQPVATQQQASLANKAFEPEMLAIPAGSFTMGCKTGRDEVEGGCSSDEKPPHKVNVAAFAMGKTEVTFAQWDACEKAGVCPHADDQAWGRNDRPVINVSWDDAKTYINWLKAETGKSYRLPTEAEWEYAARGGSDTHAFPWGDSISHDNANYGKDECCGGLISGKDEWLNTAPVAKFPANAYGLHDMAGNVWEWVEDCYHGSYDKAPDNHAAWVSDCGTAVRRVLRGGSWSSSARNVRSADRYWDAPDYSNDNYGFRLALGQ